MIARMFLVAAAVTAIAPSAANAQAWIGQAVGEGMVNDRNRCLGGRQGGWPEAELAEARMPAQAHVADYWTRAAAADPADVSTAFLRSGRVEWVANGVTRNRADLARISDPMARDADLALTPAPLSFERGLNPFGSILARGLWEVRSRRDPSRIAGYYRVDFRNGVRDRWKISRIELLPASPVPAAVPPFCERPGDIEVAAAAAAEQQARRRAREAERARRAASR